MKLGDGVEAAIHCTTTAAGLPPGAVLPASALAEFHGVSASYLVKHLKALVASGVLASVPGPAGGYRLGRKAEEITLLDIVLAVEGPEPAFRCGEIRQRGPCVPDASAYPAPCGINAAMLRAERAYRAALAEVRVSDLVTEFLETSDPRVVRRGVAFVKAHQRGQPKKG
ncbi:MAG: Rrf2 family transcriptional regulator [Pseudomonadota bacterium]